MQHQDYPCLWSGVIALAKAEREWKDTEDQMPEKTEESTTVEEANGEADEQPTSLTPAGAEWLDAAFVAESTENDESDIKDLEVRNAVDEGSNYCSTLMRVRARTSAGEPINLIIKTLPKGELMMNFVTIFDFFRMEINMLTKTLPALQALGAARCGEDSIFARPLGPRCLPCSRPDTLVMEDLSALGFKNANRWHQLDMTHCKVALAMLARFHALSVAMHREDPDFVEEYKERMLTPENTEGAAHMEQCFRNFGLEIDTWDEGTDYGERFRALAPTVLARMCACVERKEDSPFNVMNHGDFWINNFMFRYDGDGEEGEEPADIRLVDLQMSRFASLALDLQYFINTSVREEIRLTALDELLESYRENFNENLIQLGVGDGAISAAELKEEYVDKSFFGLEAAICITCLVVADPSERLRVEDLKPNDFINTDPMASAWRGKRYRTLVPRMIEDFANLGVL